MEGLHGAAVVEAFAERFPNARILVLSMVHDPSDIRRAIGAGARGYLLKEAAAAELADAIARIMNGERYVQPALGAMLAGEAPSSGHADPVAALTDREREVLDPWCSDTRTSRSLRSCSSRRGRSRPTGPASNASSG